MRLCFVPAAPLSRLQVPIPEFPIDDDVVLEPQQHLDAWDQLAEQPLAISWRLLKKVQQATHPFWLTGTDASVLQAKKSGKSISGPPPGGKLPELVLMLLERKL